MPANLLRLLTLGALAAISLHSAPARAQGDLLDPLNPYNRINPASPWYPVYNNNGPSQPVQWVPPVVENPERGGTPLADLLPGKSKVVLSDLKLPGGGGFRGKHVTLYYQGGKQVEAPNLQAPYCEMRIVAKYGVTFSYKYLVLSGSSEPAKLADGREQVTMRLYLGLLDRVFSPRVSKPLSFRCFTPKGSAPMTLDQFKEQFGGAVYWGYDG